MKRKGNGKAEGITFSQGLWVAPHTLQKELQQTARSRPLKWAVMISLFITTLASAYVTYSTYQRVAVSEFENELAPIAVQLQSRISSYVKILEAAQGFFSGSDSVERNEFERFFDSVNIRKNFRGLNGIAYVAIVPESEKQQFTAKVRNDTSLYSSGFPSFAVFPSSSTAEHWVITYAEPMSDLKKVLGYDFRTDPIRTSVLERARDTGLGSVSPVIKLAADIVDKSETASAPDAMIVAVPLYRNGVPHSTVEERRAAIVGFLSGGIYVDEMISDIANEFVLPRGIEMKLFLSNPDSTERVPVVNVPKQVSAFNSKPGLEKQVHFAMESSEWTVVFSALPSSDFYSGARTKGWLVFGMGVLTSISVWAVLRNANSSRSNLLKMVVESTKDLEDANSLMMEILDIVPIPLFLKSGRDLTFQFWNRGMEELFHIPRNEILGLTGYETFAADEMKGFIEIDRKSLSSGELVATEETATTKDGQTRQLFTRKIPVGGHKGKSKYLLGITEDITAQRKQENERILNQKLQAVGSLASGIAHEINTPMQYVSFNLHYLKKNVPAVMQKQEPLPAETQLSLSKIQQTIEQSLEGVDRVIQIVGALREFSHPGQNERRSVELNKLLDDSILICANAWKHIANVHTTFDPTIGRIQGFPGELGQVFINIISNAAHAIEEKGLGEPGEIGVATCRDGNNVVITISDNGIGIPREVLDKIYDPFFTTKDVGRGTGQGLSIARSIIVDRHGGSVCCDSVAGHGAKFTITFPIVVEEAKENEMHIC